MFLVAQLFVLFAFGICKVSMFWQEDYTVNYEHVRLEYVNPEVFEFLELRNVKPNRTHKAFSLRSNLLLDIPDNDSYKANVKAYKLSTNSPDLLIFQYDIKLCQCLKKRIFGIDDLFRKGNFTPCPIKKGYYYFSNFILDYRRLPPGIPQGRYKFHVKLVFDTKTMAIGSLFLEVVYNVRS
ncbi:hypothetical protein Trydic_g20110 [Trypoxylus dichotomus]